MVWMLAVDNRVYIRWSIFIVRYKRGSYTTISQQYWNSKLLELSQYYIAAVKQFP